MPTTGFAQKALVFHSLLCSIPSCTKRRERMRKGTNKTSGQWLYEIWASLDTSIRYLCEWRDVADDEKTAIEELAATQILPSLQGKQEDQEED